MHTVPLSLTSLQTLQKFSHLFALARQAPSWADGAGICTYFMEKVGHLPQPARIWGPRTGWSLLCEEIRTRTSVLPEPRGINIIVAIDGFGLSLDPAPSQSSVATIYRVLSASGVREP